MRIGIRLALSALVLTSIALPAGLVHGLWRATADANSRALAETLNRQIADTVKKELAGRIADAEAAFGAVRTIFLQNVIATREADKREFVFLSQIEAQPSLSWIAFGWPDGAFFASHKLGDGGIEMMEIAVDGEHAGQRRVDRYRVVPGDIEFEARSFVPSDYEVLKQAWYQRATAAAGPTWFDVRTHPAFKRAAIAYAGPIDVYQERQGVLAVMIELDRLSRFLGRLNVGQAGGAFILGDDGHIVAGPDAEADEVRGTDLSGHPLLPVAREAGFLLIDKAKAADMSRDTLRFIEAGTAYATAITPLGFAGWQVAVIIPEAEFLGEIDKTTTRLSLGLLGLVLVAGLAAMFVARRLIAEPLRAVVGDLRHVEEFDLACIAHRPSRLRELDALSSALVRMAGGLSAFGKYLPTDLVRTLVAEGVEAKPGGAMKPLTVLFADVAGFTGLSERLGDQIVPLIGAYLDAASRAVERRHGTIDKFIGDAVMAFWGAPRPNPDHARDACRGALALWQAVRDRGLADDTGKPLEVRIGVNSGAVLVGNIGSESRLNYTVIGDAVNVASRLEAINKIYGTSIIIGEETRRLAGDAIVVRELDRIAVYGRMQGLAIYELVVTRREGEPPPSWIALFEAGLAHYRARRWREAIGAFETVIAMRGHDAPSLLMIERCRGLIEQPPAESWAAVTVMDSK